MSGILAKMGNLQFSSGSLFANRFEIQLTAGSGGMGTVYRATDRYSGDTVALKLLHAGEGHGEAERFAREAQLLSELRHPGIVAHVAHGQTPDGQRFLAMEWLEGQDLGQRLARGPLSVRDCLRLIEQVADALSIAHQCGIIHRDLKPSNLFLIGGDIGRVKILDFGIARRIASSQAMTRTGMVIGTPEYMAPEQARGSRDLTPAADLFSLGCVLYECLTGQPPFVADHVAAVLVRILFEEPQAIEERRPGIPASLAAVVDRLLLKDPAQRIADAAGLRAEILNLGELPEPALAVTMAGPRPKAESFAEQEQNLFSIVLAAPPEEDLGLGATMPGSEQLLAHTDRQALLQAVAALGAAADFLANVGLIVTVPSLESAQDQATRAARAALLIKERWPQAVVSMATGRGAIRGRTAVGEVVEAAVRSLKTGSHSALAPPATGVLLDSLSAKLLEGRFAQTPQPDGALLLYEERDADASRPLLGKPTPCVGRDAELNNLEGQLSSCIDESEARVMLVTAPPGIGKSRLRHEFLRRVERRSDAITKLVGRGDLMSAGSPYGILSDALHRLCEISGSEPLDIQQERLRARIAQHVAAADQDRVVLFLGELCKIPFADTGKPMLQAARRDPKIMRDSLRRAFLDWLAGECKASPVVVVLDDLQWGDELTVMALHEALRELAGEPLFILAFARPEVRDTYPTLWQGHKLQEIQLKGLSKKASERLIQQVLGKNVEPEAVARAVEQAGGNALFLEEMIRSLAEGKSNDQPETVLAMLQARIGRLDSGARRAVRAASVFGQTFWEGGVAAILALPKCSPEVQKGLAALCEAELVHMQPLSTLPSEREYSFRHALVCDAAYSLLTANDLHTGHRLAGEFLEAAGAIDPAVLAEHFVRGGEKKRAAVFYSRAAEKAGKHGDALDMLRLVERGLACDAEGELLGELRSLEGHAARHLNQMQRSGEAAAAALALVRPGSLHFCCAADVACYAALHVQDPARLRDIFSLLLHTEPQSGAQTAYIEAIAVAVAPFSYVAPASLIATVRARVAAILPAAEMIDGSIRLRWHVGSTYITLVREPKPWTVVQEGVRALQLCREAGANDTELLALAVIPEYSWVALGDAEGAQKRLMALEGVTSKCQDVFAVGIWRVTLGSVLCSQNSETAWAQAEQILMPVAKEADSYWSAFALAGLAAVAARRGQLEQAEAQSRALMSAFSNWGLLQLGITALRMRVLLGLGRAAEATAVAEQALAILAMLGGAGMSEVTTRLCASESFHAAGNVARAHSEMHETLHQIKLRADDITDPFWKNSYLTRNPSVVRAQQLAKQWGLDVDVS